MDKILELLGKTDNAQHMYYLGVLYYKLEKEFLKQLEKEVKK